MTDPIIVECLERIKKTRSSAYENFHNPTVVYKKKGPPTHHGFKCKHCNRIIERAIDLQKLLHPDARKYEPHCDTISKDIWRIYEATQGEITKMLAAQEGVFHLALDLFQSSNGLDFLRIVIFRHFFTLDKPATVEHFVFECLNHTDTQSGEALVKVLHSVMLKFKIEDCVWGIVCDNVSNN
ncbi:hypothetical protein BDV93DRAFT_514075, partial [Ceratobasidium sp. AG-I]